MQIVPPPLSVYIKVTALDRCIEIDCKIAP